MYAVTPTRATPVHSWISSVLEGDPHAVIEAMAIAGYAIGADTGLYLRKSGISHRRSASYR